MMNLQLKLSGNNVKKHFLRTMQVHSLRNNQFNTYNYNNNNDDCQLNVFPPKRPSKVSTCLLKCNSLKITTQRPNNMPNNLISGGGGGGRGLIKG